MKHKSINLLPDIEEDSSYLRRIKKIAPIIAGTSLIIFLVFYSVSLLYVQQNLREFNRINTEIDLLERKISLEKPRESVYLTSISVLETIKKVLSADSKIIINILPVIINTPDTGILLSQATIDQSGKVSLTISAPSIDTLEIFVSEMIKHERISGFNNIIANGIVRDSAGSYSLSVELNVNNRKSLDSALKK
ncbi:hypothetical protein A3D05_06665 [Candidatus Gottesmanbacteria bacterium RIFCSPHIGHO2_02_FULL_40_24]|uniref:Uncharacterized protein n=1 Tax=Candidatus Gottesmanbacteria bacterium RIFCSPHIGHO2_01_FULL_40_15 TaxID=1798376 RepID=A0A1F5Z3N4_9BACT|nr:MAG: hypothetical protein A2777_03715 [Candidatus Gottesmanbacteria bacterium RIFCSPHIGHO2_01_FULL_40_15]OGG17194.1 MAG: hypothetical protein A3D05_06665 [Candidatus Gottesmanbacteria bacterium RIFCSPHIGHO2_02_FULL_40_24]OGG22371.1 MAG: hypothetical protein A3B48_02595 [Candidatus Gottesmanbacteria bacterium RIFCSPLOWO2_01_FULL_40_10]OGG23588.1 MAG: hypothetical protein A3E42_05400 [Candidatus Gottesmanbacteria bacterium RIFCSPHIGHO2_12_FULL_40_13]OGG32226.1 MAG: hypothetical protein A3I80_0